MPSSLMEMSCGDLASVSTLPPQTSIQLSEYNGGGDSEANYLGAYLEGKPQMSMNRSFDTRVFFVLNYLYWFILTDIF